MPNANSMQTNKETSNARTGKNKEAGEYGTKFEQNVSKNHPTPQSDNHNTQKLQQNATDLKNHPQGMKSESEYEEGAHGEIGEDARRSRRAAEEFQKLQDQ